MFGVFGKSLKYVAAAALLVISGFGVVSFVSAHGGPVSSGVIHTCVNNSSGEIKIVQATATCKNNHTALDWNAQGIPGANGTNGTNGTNGANGADGADGVSGYEIVEEEAFPDFEPLGVNIAVGLVIECPAGKKVLGGGSQSNTDLVITLESYPLTDDSWFVRHINLSGVPVGGVQINGYAICADVS